AGHNERAAALPARDNGAFSLENAPCPDAGPGTRLRGGAYAGRGPAAPQPVPGPAPCRGRRHPNHRSKGKARQTVRAVECRGPEAVVTEVPDPAPAPDEVVVEVDACGLCGSDVHTLQNGHAADGQILGHEFSGRIAGVGRDVTGWREGQPVAAS